MSSYYSLPDRTASFLPDHTVPIDRFFPSHLGDSVSTVPGSIKDWVLGLHTEETAPDGSYVPTDVELLNGGNTVSAAPYPDSEWLYRNRSAFQKDGISDLSEDYLRRVKDEPQSAAIQRPAHVLIYAENLSLGPESAQSRSNSNTSMWVPYDGPPKTDRQPRREKLSPSQHHAKKAAANGSQDHEMIDYGTAAPVRRQRPGHEVPSEFEFSGTRTVHEGFSQFSFPVRAKNVGGSWVTSTSSNGFIEPVIFNQDDDFRQATDINNVSCDCHKTSSSTSRYYSSDSAASVLA